MRGGSGSHEPLGSTRSQSLLEGLVTRPALRYIRSCCLIRRRQLMSPNTTPPRLHRPPRARREIVDYVVSEREAAEIIGVSPDTLRRMVKRGEGPDRIKISARRIGYRLSALNDFLACVTEAVRNQEAQSQKVSPEKG